MTGEKKWTASWETRMFWRTWIVCVHYSEDGLQSRAVLVKSLQQRLLNVLQETGRLVTWHKSLDIICLCVQIIY